MNDNLIQLKDVITYLNLYNSNIKVVPEGVFMRSFSNSNSKLKMRNMICISNGKYQIEANPYVKNDITRLLLEESGFKWPKIERDYFGIFK